MNPSWLRVKRWGTVRTDKDGTLYFQDNRRLGPVTFHTHYIAEKHGGFQPPSVLDLETLITDKFNSKTHTHYVLTEKGVFTVHIKCNMSKSSYQKLMRAVRSMREQMHPGPKHHQRWMKTVNGICPRCFGVEFQPRSSF